TPFLTHIASLRRNSIEDAAPAALALSLNGAVRVPRSRDHPPNERGSHFEGLPSRRNRLQRDGGEGAQELRPPLVEDTSGAAAFSGARGPRLLRPCPSRRDSGRRSGR